MKNEKLVVASFALVTVPSDGTPMSRVSPKETAQKSVLATGAVVKVIAPALTVYAVTGSCTTPPNDTIIVDGLVGYTATESAVRLKVVVDPLKLLLISSSL